MKLVYKQGAWHGKADLIALESGLPCFDRARARAESSRAEDGRFGGAVRALRRAAGFCGSIAPTRVSLGRAEGGRRSGRASLLVQNTVGGG